MMVNRNVLARRRVQAEQQRRAFVEALDREQLEQRIQSLASAGLTDYDISLATSLAVEQVRQIIGPTTGAARVTELVMILHWLSIRWRRGREQQ